MINEKTIVQREVSNDELIWWSQLSFLYHFYISWKNHNYCFRFLILESDRTQIVEKCEYIFELAIKEYLGTVVLIKWLHFKLYYILSFDIDVKLMRARYFWKSRDSVKLQKNLNSEVELEEWTSRNFQMDFVKMINHETINQRQVSWSLSVGPEQHLRTIIM